MIDTTKEATPRVIRIGYQGVPGAYSQAALKCALESEFDGRDGWGEAAQVESIGFDSFGSTHTALGKGTVDFIFVSICAAGNIDWVHAVLKSTFNL